MKLGNIKNLFFGICGVVAAASIFSACNLEPYEMPQEELYLRSFIKKYGLIDPNQDFNEAMRTEVSVVVGNKPQDVNVYVKNLDRFYRVAYYAKAVGEITIPVDVPQATKEIYVEVGDKAYRAPLGVTIDATASKGSRADTYTEDEITGTPEDLAWVLVCEDLGATDDFDFNDMIIRLEALSINDEAYELLKLQVDVSEWEIIEWDEHLQLGDVHKAQSRDGSRADDTPVFGTKIRVTALAAGGTLPLYLHFQSDANNEDTDMLVTFDYGLISINDGLATDNYEWHRWFNETDVQQMINTGCEPIMRQGKSSTFFLSGDFSMTNFSRVFSNYWGIQENGVDIPLPPGTSFTTDQYSNTNKPIQGFFITVNSKYRNDAQSVLAGSTPGNAPQIFLIPDMSNHTDDGLWHWPKERLSITECYDGFRNWVNSGSSWWYNALKDENMVMPRP